MEQQTPDKRGEADELSCLFRIPIEVLHMVTDFLNMVDILNLSLTSQHFRYLIHNGSMCQKALLVSTIHSCCHQFHPYLFTSDTHTW
jgi:hypothetical protein